MSSRRNRGGFTLIEVVVAVAVLGVMATTVLGGVLFSLTQSRRAQIRAQAAAWVQSELDFLRVQGYGIPVTTAPRRFPDTTQPNEGYIDYANLLEPRVPAGFYQAEVEVTPVSGIPLKRLVVRLYQTPTSQPYTILVTYVSNFTYQ
ncbi:MAG: prepilin-type N-terminal cleavage/methylation domain-containing protein [Armatimonadetes bacterium]|nr:prepilin-type N-terminal cleavage/methylation domain-containing protein [Armatimonadota bacterium]